MNTSAQRSNLPWFAAGTAMLVVLAWRCISFGTMMLRAPSDNEQILNFVAITLRALGEGWLIQGGLAFLIAQSRGERRQEWAFQRPLLLLGVFAGGLLAWNVLAMFVYQGFFMLLSPEELGRWLRSLMAVLDLALSPLIVWSSWRLALLVCRDERVAVPPQSGLRPRAAGLAAWMQAMGVILGVSMLLPLFGSFDMYSTVGWISSWAGALLAAALAFGGAWLGLPRELSLVRAGRLFGAGALTFVCANLVLGAVGVAVLVLIFGGGGRADEALLIALFVVLGVLPLLGMLGFQWLWTRVLYRKQRRAAAA